MSTPAPSIFRRLTDYLRMIKFSHSIFALPFAGIALLLALPDSGLLDAGLLHQALWVLVGQVIVAMVSLRSAAMGFNRIVDRHFDAANPRTASREIASGKIGLRDGYLFVALSLVVFFATAFSINALTGYLSPLAVALVLGYSYTKRFTYLCHYFLGLAIGAAPTATWIAVRGEIDLLPLIWTVGMAFYIAGFDILYSCQDADFDRSQKLRSIPSEFGIAAALYIARISHIVALLFFTWAGVLSGGGLLFWLFWLLTALLFYTQHRMVRPNALDKIPIAFFHINAAISLILFLGLLFDRLMPISIFIPGLLH